MACRALTPIFDIDEATIAQIFDFNKATHIQANPLAVICAKLDNKIHPFLHGSSHNFLNSKANVCYC